MKDGNNIHCEVATGECTPVKESNIEEIIIKQQPKVTLIYYTDPICSACWAIEPALKKFKLEYGEYVNISYKMGGLLPGWEGFADNSNGISKPSDVAHHWDEVGQYSGMSIDGDVWLEDPLSSSFPPSIAFKAMQNQGDEKALKFLRRIREMVFLEKKNITKEEFLIKAVEECNGNTTEFLTDYHDQKTNELFLAEMKEGRDMGVRGFPTFIFVSEQGNGFKISGTSAYSNYVLALEKAYGKSLTPEQIELNEYELLTHYNFLSTKELAVILSKDEKSITTSLHQLSEEGKVEAVQQKYGVFWRLIN